MFTCLLIRKKVDSSQFLRSITCTAFYYTLRDYCCFHLKFLIKSSILLILVNLNNVPALTFFFLELYVNSYTKPAQKVIKEFLFCLTRETLYIFRRRY